MRLAPALAATALVILAAACKPSSLTPFTDWREQETSTGINGDWEGATVRFVVGSDTVSNLMLDHGAGTCAIQFTIDEEAIVADDDTFGFDVLLDPGRLVVDGTFTSSTTCTGTYSFEGLDAAEGCPTSGSGTFDAAKTP